MKPARSASILAMILAGALGALASPAVAKPPKGSGASEVSGGESPAVKRAREHYKAGEKAFNAGDFEKARAEFEAGYRLVPRPGFLLNMAHSERRLGHSRSARAIYKRYLLADPESEQRDEVLGFIAKLDASIADEEKAASRSAAAPGPAPAPSPPPPAPPPPPAAVAAPAPAPAPKPTLASLSAEEPSAGQPAPAVDLRARAPEPEESPSGGAFYTRWWFWTAVVVVAAGAGAGAYYFATRDGPVFHDDGSLGRVGSP